MNLSSRTLDFVIIGKSILSSFQNPQADVYRGLVAELAQLGHRTVFLEREYISHPVQRDMLRSPYCDVWTYESIDKLLIEYRDAIRAADVVLLGNGVENATKIATWIGENARGIKAYYDTDLARTFNSLQNDNNDTECLACNVVPLFDLYLSTTGGEALKKLSNEYGCRYARPLYESIDPYFYYRTDVAKTYDLGYIGNYKVERQEQLSELLISPAVHTPNRNFVLIGADYPPENELPSNLTYLEFLPEANIVDFYNRQHCTLVVARPDRKNMGFTPSRRLLAAAACGVPILADDWLGLNSFFEPSREIFVVDDCNSVLDVLYQTGPDERRKMGDLARERVLAEHTTAKRTQQLLNYWKEIAD